MRRCDWGGQVEITLPPLLTKEGKWSRPGLVSGAVDAGPRGAGRSGSGRWRGMPARSTGAKHKQNCGPDKTNHATRGVSSYLVMSLDAISSIAAVSASRASNK